MKTITITNLIKDIYYIFDDVLKNNDFIKVINTKNNKNVVILSEKKWLVLKRLYIYIVQEL
ncbi:MAG: hypothetical protein LBR40_04905 [Bacilli bacterium]|jgi:hypothetical protein|nr:hypothetical protein [Bacilli bacterium]